MAVGRGVVEQAREDEITFLAASIAYYAFVSLIPLLLFTFVAASVIGGQALANQIVDQASGFLAPAGQSALEDAITAETGRGGATVVGTVVLLWSALKLFRGLDTAFSLVYDAGLDKSIIDQISTALIVFISILLAVLGMLALGAIFALVPSVPFIGLLTPLIVMVALSVVFLPMYYFLPDVKTITVRQAFPGALLAAVGWSVLQSLFGLYASNAGQYEAYGVIGGILLLFTWLYIGGIVIILGAILNAVLMSNDTDTPDEPGETEEAASTDESATETTEPADEGGRATDRTGTATGTGSAAAPDLTGLQDDLQDLRSDLDGFRSDIEERTLSREEVESDLKDYVRKRMRRGHATSWGPYLVLLYGTAMTLGAFFFLTGYWAIIAMVILWLSTLGLYVMMVMVGVGLGALGFPGRVRDAIKTWRG